MPNPRKLAVSALVKIERDNAYSNLTLNSFLKDFDLSKEDKALFSALVYGVLDRKITIDYVLSKFMKTPLKKTAPFTLNVLRVGLYQIMYMDKIPESAAVNESVKIIKSSKENRNAGFVNAVLRSVIRNPLELPNGDSPKDLSIKYSCPEWIVKGFLDDYGIENTVKLLEESLEAPPVTLRVNTVKISLEELIEKLCKMGINASLGEVENSVIFRGVKVGKGAKVKNCVLMQGTIVGENANLDCVITDKNVIIRNSRTLTGCDTYPIVIGKGRNV